MYQVLEIKKNIRHHYIIEKKEGHQSSYKSFKKKGDLVT
jgi:hypothetical protein